MERRRAISDVLEMIKDVEDNNIDHLTITELNELLSLVVSIRHFEMEEKIKQACTKKIFSNLAENNE